MVRNGLVGERGVLDRQNMLNLTKVVCQWFLKGHFGQWIDIHWIYWSRISQGIYTMSRSRMVIDNVSCHQEYFYDSVG